MSARFVLHGDQCHPAEPSPAEGFVAERFEHVLSQFRLFMEHPGPCLDLAEAVVRALPEGDDPCEGALYALIAANLRRVEEVPAAGDGFPRDSLVCLLLKEHAGLSYAEIAAMLGTSRAVVRDRIAAARAAVLA